MTQTNTQDEKIVEKESAPTETASDVFPETVDITKDESLKALSDTENTQGGLVIDTSNANLSSLTTEALLEKRKALMWIATSGAAMKESVPFFKDELGPIEEELKSRGVTLP